MTDKYSLWILIQEEKVLGASMENPTHGKGHEEEASRAKVRSGLKGPPELTRASTPKPESVLLFYVFHQLF